MNAADLSQLIPNLPDLSFLIPNLPAGFDAWDAFVTILAIIVMKLTRARFMKARSRYIDRFGWSIIMFDVVFALVFATSILFSLYPGLRPDVVWTGRVLTNALFLVSMWQLIEVLLVPEERVDAAMSGAPSPPDTGDRRRWDRRKETRDMKMRLSELERGQ